MSLGRMSLSMVENQFHPSNQSTLGVELELQLVDASTLALRNGVDGILAELPSSFGGSVKREFHSCCVEINTDVCTNVDEVRRDLKTKLLSVAGVCAQRGLLLAWGGTHPFSHWKDQVVASEPRYAALADLYQETILRQLTFGMHVHVGVASGDEATRVCDRIRDHLPVLLALSANSPFWCGRATGLLSHRIDVMGSLPTVGVPPRLGDWASYLALVEHLTDCGFIETPKDLWWDVRPSPPHGTVEVRICDMPLGLEMVLGLTAMVQCLVRVLSKDDILLGTRGVSGEDDRDQDRAHLLILERNRWLAARYGLDAPLVDPGTRDKTPARVLARGLIDRLLEAGEDLGCSEFLRNLRTRTWGPNGALSQLTTYSRTGNLKEVVRVMARADSSGHTRTSLSPPQDYGPILSSLDASV
jgi:carboxylate-amine ligase